MLALDLSEAMLEQAAANIATAGLSDRIQCHHGDAKSLLNAFGDGSFEGVVSNTIIHHIPDPEPVLAEMARLVAPGGTLWCATWRGRLHTMRSSAWPIFMPLRRPRRPGRCLKRRWPRRLTLDEIREILRSLGHDAGLVSMTSDRHWTWCWRRP